MLEHLNKWLLPGKGALVLGWGTTSGVLKMLSICLFVLGKAGASTGVGDHFGRPQDAE